MSGHAHYTGVEENMPPINIPVIEATRSSLRGYAEIVELDDFDTTPVINRTWPSEGKRELEPSTGNQASATEGLFEFWYSQTRAHARNCSVPDGEYVTGIRTGTHVLTREANYHPCGGQIVCPIVQGDAFVMLLATPGDDVHPDDFVAFRCDGSFGLQILPGVWHQPAYPVNTGVVTTMRNKQCSVHACVRVDFVDEFYTLLQVRLQ